MTSQKSNDPAAYPVYQQSDTSRAGEAAGNAMVPSRATTIQNANSGMPSMFPTLLDETDMFYQVSTSTATGAYQQQGSTNHQDVGLHLSNNNAGVTFMQPQPQIMHFFPQNNILASSNSCQPPFFLGFENSCQQQHEALNPKPPQSSCQYQIQFPAQTAQGGTQDDSLANVSGTSQLVKTVSSTHVEKATDHIQDSANTKELTGLRSKITRERNREHARSSRIRKKEYVSQLTGLVQELHVQLAEEGRKRRLAMQHLSEVQAARCAVMHSFLSFLTDYESDESKWSTLLEDEFWLKQPLTPFRYFTQSEGKGDHRVSRGVKGMINEAASLSVMVDSIGNRSSQCREIQAEYFLQRLGGEVSCLLQPPSVAIEQEANASSRATSEDELRNNLNSSLQRQDSQMPSSVGGTFREVSSLSSRSGDGSSGSSCYSRMKEDSPRKRKWSSKGGETQSKKSRFGVSVVTSEESAQAQHTKMGSSYGSESGPTTSAGGCSSNDFHDYNAPSLPDPLPDAVGRNKAGGSSFSHHSKSRQYDCRADKQDEDERYCWEQSSKIEHATMLSKTACSGTFRLPDDCTANAVKDGKQSNGSTLNESDLELPAVISTVCATTTPAMTKPTNTSASISNNSLITSRSTFSGRRNIADTPSVRLPPFLGLGKKSISSNTNKFGSSAILGHTETLTSFNSNNDEKICIASKSFPTSRRSPVYSEGSNGYNDNDTLSYSASTNRHPKIRAFFDMNEDDMVHTGDVMMSRFLFRSQDAVLCGALAEVHMQGMLRAQFSSSNKLLNIEMIYDALGFMQQLEKSSGSEGNAQVIPNSLEMAFSPADGEARAITLAEAPYPIISVNEAWTQLTKYTQSEAEGKELSILYGNLTDPLAGKQNRKPIHECGEVARGRCACSTNIHFDKNGRAFIDYVCSYPLTK